MTKIHTFELRIVETIQRTPEPYDKTRTKRDVATYAIAVETNEGENVARTRVAAALRALEHAAALAVGAK